MIKSKTVAIAVSFEEGSLPGLLKIRELDFLAEAQLHLVHIFSTINYAVGFAEAPLIYPVETDRSSIEVAMLKKLSDLTREILPSDFRGEVHQHCLFHDNPKEKFCDFANSVRADFVIVATRRRRGLFESSFTHYLERHSDCDLIVLKSDNIL